VSAAVHGAVAGSAFVGFSSLGWLVPAVRQYLSGRQPGALHAEFGETGPLPQPAAADAVEIRHCPRHGNQAHRITHTTATCWTCIHNTNGGAR
jgi:hypothetical protein